ncbi:MAG: amino acid permease, partial [Anaerolineales bacterium]|nr:amino acid permease [Anaerolineales bacterium]
MKDETESFLGELRLSRHLQSITQVSALGLTVALGLSFIIPVQIIIESGIQSATPVLLAILVLGLTLLNIHELLGGSGERGGIHALIHESLGKSMGFIAAWSSLAANLLLCAALLKSASRSLVALFPEVETYATLAAVGMLILLVLINLFHLLPRRGMLPLVLLVLLVAFVALLISAIPYWEPSSASSLSDSSAKNYLLAIASSITLFAGLEAITSSKRRILTPNIRLPQGLWITLLLGGLLLISAQLFIPALPIFPVLDESTAVTRSLTGTGGFQTWLTAGVMFFALLLAASECMLTSARVLYSLSRMEALPRIFTRIRRPFRLPPYIFITLTLMGSLLILLMPFAWLIEIAAGLFLIQVILVNLAAIRSRQAEPERRRTIVIPFFPLVPLLALTFSVVLFFGLVPVGLLGAAGWTAIGLVLLFAYARPHLLDAQHGVTVFGQDPETKRREGAFRVLVPLGSRMERRFILGLANALARQTNGDVVPLQVIPTADPLAIQEGRRIAEERNTLFKWSTRESARNSVPTYPITRLASSVAQGIKDTAVEENCSLILMSWPMETPEEGMRTGRILDPVVNSAPCDVAVIAYHPERLSSLQVEEGQVDGDIESPPFQIKRILTPTAGGPHAPLAMQLALLLAREFDATTQTVYVTRPDATESELEEGRQRIKSTIEALREQLSLLPHVDESSTDMGQFPIESHVVRAHTVVEGIVQA